MAFDTANISQVYYGGIAGTRLWAYTTTDAINTVLANNYFVNSEHTTLQAGDSIYVAIVDDIRAPTTSENYVVAVVSTTSDIVTNYQGVTPETSVPTTAALEAYTRPMGSSYVVTLGNLAAGDGGGGLWRYDATNVAVATNYPELIIGGDDAVWVNININATTPLSYGAAGDGTTDDSAAFKLIEADPSARVIDLKGKTYSIVSTWIDPTDGAKLTKDYFNGDILVDGRPLIQNSEYGRSASAAAAEARLPKSTGNKPLALYKVDDDNYFAWRHLLGTIWARYKFTRTTSGIPLNWNETFIKQIVAYKAARESGVVYNGTWATDGGTTALKSEGGAYISGRAQQATTAGDYVDITFTGGGDLFVIFTSRDSGNYVNVTLDSAQDYIILPDDGSGNRYFDSYSAVDQIKGNIVHVASGVPETSHTLRLTLSATKHASSTGDRFIFEALSWNGSTTGPYTPEADCPAWQTGEDVLQYQERKSDGKYYYADADGTTGATAPTHSSGSVSDGTVSWTYRDETSYALTDHRIQAAGSQLEYAYQVKPTGATALEDVGGALHGNEAQTSEQWYLSGAPVSVPTAAWLVGDEIMLAEEIDVTHSEIGGGSTVINETMLKYFVRAAGVTVEHSHDWQVGGEFGYYYPHMWPLLHYSSVGQKYGVRRLWSPSDGDRLSSDWYSVSNPFVARVKDLLCIAYGDALQPDGSGGVPTTTPATLGFVASLKVDPESVDGYKDARSVFMAKAMNTSGVDVSSGGFSSATNKIYFERYSGEAPKAFSSGFAFTCTAHYGLEVFAK